jgi:hypothetical protein
LNCGERARKFHEPRSVLAEIGPVWPALSGAKNFTNYDTALNLKAEGVSGGKWLRI